MERAHLDSGEFPVQRPSLSGAPAGQVEAKRGEEAGSNSTLQKDPHRWTPSSLPRSIHGSLVSILHAIELERTWRQHTQDIHIFAIGVPTSTGGLHVVRFRPGTSF